MAMKRRIILISVLLVLLALLATGSVAYFTTEQTAQNVITAGTVDISVLTTTQDGTPFPQEGVRIMPGDTIDKVVTVKNNGSGALYLRLKLTASVEDSDLPADDCMIINIDTTKWTLHEDGYYYYNVALEAGQTSAPLFEQVTFDGSKVTNEYRGKAFLLAVDAQAVQSANNGTSALSALGWPAA